MNGFWVSLRKEWLELWRTYRLLVACVVLVAMGLLSPFLTKYTPELMKALPETESISQLFSNPTVMDAVLQYVKSIGQFGLILGLLFTMGVVAQEKEKGTAGMVLTKPLSRAAFVTAKFAALALLFLVAIALAGSAGFYYTFLMFGDLNISHWLALNALIFLYVLDYIAITLFFSVATKSQAAAGGLAFGVMLVLEILATIPSFGKFTPAKLLGWGIDLMGGNTDIAWGALIVGVGIICAAVLGACLIFKKQEL